MANKPKYFDIEDYETGKTYRVEAYEDDVTYDEAVSYLESLPEDQWSQFEYTPSVPAKTQTRQASPVTTPAEPVGVSTASNEPTPVGAIEANAGDGTRTTYTRSRKNIPEVDDTIATLWRQGVRDPEEFNRALAPLYEKYPELVNAYSNISSRSIAQAQQYEAYQKARGKDPKGYVFSPAVVETGEEDPEKPESVLDTLVTAAGRSAGQMYNSGVGIAALGADVVGADETSNSLLQHYILNNAKLDYNLPRPVDSYKDIDSFGSAGLYALDTLGELAPQLVTSVGAGVLGKEAAKRLVAKSVDDMVEQQISAGLTREAAEQATKQYVDKIAQRGMIAGAFVPSAIQETGSTFGDTYIQTGEKAPALSIAAGLTSASLDSILPVSILKKLNLSPDVVQGRFVTELLKQGSKGFLMEGATEAVQEFITQLPASVINGESPFTAQMFDQMSEAFIRGGIGGKTSNIAVTSYNALNSRQSTGNAAQGSTDSSISVPTGDRRSKAYREQMATAIGQTVDHINSITEGWTNKPDITVHNNFSKLNGIEKKALGVYMGDGSIALNMEQIDKRSKRLGLTPEEVVNSVVFHESLGHFALNQEYGATLDDTLDNFYTNGTERFQNLVNEWMDNNPNLYTKGDPRGIIDDPELYRRVRATEEVMAKWAEDEGVIPKKMIDTFINMVKDFLRRMNIRGYQPRYSPREVKSLLAIAQEQVTKKPGTDAGAPGSPRYMYIGRQELENNRVRGTATPWSEQLLEDLEATQDNFADQMMMADPEDRDAILQMYSTDGESRRASGWFIGPDKKWRFEISDENARLTNLPAPGETMLLSEVLDHPGLYEIYQNLGEDIDVTTRVMPSNNLGAFNPEKGLLTLNAMYRDALLRNSPEDQEMIEGALNTVLHEVQHGIQDMEGFASGGSPSMALKNLPDRVLFRGAENHAKYIKEVEAPEIATVLDAVDTLKEMPEYKTYERELAYADRLYKELENLRKKYTEKTGNRLTWEEEKSFPDIQAAKKKHNDQSLKASDARIALHSALGLPKYILASEGLTQKAITFYNEMMWLAKNKDAYDSKERLLNEKLELAGDLEYSLEELDRQDIIDLLNRDEGIAFDAYEHLFGEVEARDTERRRTLSYEERRNTSPYSLTGILPENYAVTFDGRGPANSQTMSETPDNRYMMDDEGGNKPFIDPRRPIPVSGGINSPNVAPLAEDDLFELQSAEDILLQLQEGYTPERRSWEEVKRDRSLNKGLTAGEIKRLKGIGDISLRLYQYEALQEKLSDRVTELYYKMQTGGATPQIKAQYLETMYKFKELSARIFDDQAEVGRALNFMKNLNLTRRKVGDITDMLKEYNSNGIGAFASDDFFQEFAEQVQYMINSGNPAGAANIIKQIEKPYWWQYILSARHAMMLSSLGTHAKNAYDGLMMIVREMEESTLALPLFYGRKVIGAQDGVSPQEVTARAYGLLRALLDAQTYRETWKAFKEGHQSRSYSAKIEMQDARIPVLSKVNDALYASDTFFRAFHMNANLYTLGVRKARQDGFTGMRALEEGTANAMNPTKELLQQARDMADVTLLVDSPSAIGNLIEPSKAIRPNMKGEDQAKSFLANMVFPFLRVTDRLLFQAIRRSPLSFLDKNTRAEWAAGGPQRDIAIARTVYGTALMAYYWQQAGIGDDEEGDIEGAAPGNYKKQQSLEATGYRPNSQVEGGRMLDITALNLSLNPLSTDNNIAAQIATIRQAWERGAQGETEAEEAANGMGEALRAMLGILSSQSYAENLSTFIDPLTERDPDKRETLEAGFVGGVASQFVPAALRQVNQMVYDPEKKITRGDGSFGDRVYGRIASAIPGLSETLPDRVDALGDTMPQGRTLLGIGNYTEIKQDDVSKEIRKIDRQTEKPLLTSAPSSFQLEGRTVQLTDEQQQKWNSIQGRLTRDVMTLAISEPAWKTLDLKTKVEFVKQLRSEAYEEAKKAILPEIDFEVQLKEEEL